MLTPVEQALVRSFRTTDARGKHSILSYAQGTAEDFPALRPTLTLVPNCGLKPQPQRSVATG